MPPLIEHCGFGILLVTFSLPLILGLAPRNRFYGIRTPAAFASERAWYRVNAYGGRLLLVCGLISGAIGMLAWRADAADDSLWMPLLKVASMLIVFPALLMIRAYSRRPDTL